MYQGRFQQNPSPEMTAPPTKTSPVIEPAVPAQTTPQRKPAPQRRRPPQGKRKHGTTKGTYIFYSIYLALILVFFIALTIGMGAIKDWLLDYQAAQPETASQQIFTDLFADPDWAELYRLANPNTSNDRVVEAYVDHMTEQVGDDALSFVETSGGTDVKKYYVLHGRQVVAAFSMLPVTGEDDATLWEFKDVEVYFNWACNLTYRIIVEPGCIVTVNGEVLNDSHIARTISTKAEEYLPSGLHGFRLLEYQVNGLQEEPQVSVTKGGKEAELTLNAATKTFSQVLPEASTIPDEQSALMEGAAKSYAKFIIAGGTTEMRKYFDSSSAIYKTITGGMIIRQSYTKYEFTSCEITDYYRYSDTVFSARIKLITTVHSTKYGVQDKEVDSTFIFKKTNGKWVVHDMLNLNIQDQVETVRVTFQDAAGNELSSKLVEAKSPIVSGPSVSVPAGKVFKGWQEKRVDEQGNVSLVATVYPADDSNNVSITKLEKPIVLVPVFEDKEAG